MRRALLDVVLRNRKNLEIITSFQFEAGLTQDITVLSTMFELCVIEIERFRNC